MQITCNKCNRKMSFSEFIAYFEVYLLKTLEKIMVEFLVQLAKEFLLSPKRGLIDNQMATFANVFKIACPKCESIGHWDPTVREQQKNLTKELDN